MEIINWAAKLTDEEKPFAGQKGPNHSNGVLFKWHLLLGPSKQVAQFTVKEEYFLPYSKFPKGV